jgi:hypothetical protein
VVLGNEEKIPQVSLPGGIFLCTAYILLFHFPIDAAFVFAAVFCYVEGMVGLVEEFLVFPAVVMEDCAADARCKRCVFSVFCKEGFENVFHILRLFAYAGCRRQARHINDKFIPAEAAD